MPRSRDGYEAHKEAAGRRQLEMSRAGRDIGRVPDIANVRRRSRCRASLRLFCETYNPATFYHGWSPAHLGAVARIEEAARQGALYAFAMPRGSGKTAICRMAALWAVSYGLVRYAFVIGANATKAQDNLQAVKQYIRFLEEYAADFPEISHPARELQGIAHRAAGQLSDGLPTLLEWSKDRVTLPTVRPPANWPRSWPLRSDGMVPTAGAIVSAAGLTSDGIRGSLLTLSTGESIRPDLVLLDDPQTAESAYSPSQNATREQLISADVLGMAGPGRSIAAVMPCTVIAQGDMVDRLLDRKVHPLWRGERTRMLETMPANLEAWDAYLEVYRRCALLEPPDFAEANAYYLEHRATLDAGAKASWPERKLEWEVSAVQHAMHLYARDPRAFWSEYQNEPQPLDGTADALTPARVLEQCNGLEAFRLPQSCVRATAFIDVQGTLLYWAVVGWSDDFSGHLAAYGTFPEQRRAYFLLRDASPTLAEATGVAGVEAAVYRGLTAVAASILDRQWLREDGAGVHVERLLVDANWQTETVKEWCRRSKRPEVKPAHGRYYGASAKPITSYVKKPGERIGLHWLLSQHVLYDTNFWKSFVAARLATPHPGRGSLTIWGEPDRHRMLADHLTSETPERVEAAGRAVDEWKLLPGRDNHWWDCCVGAAVAASIQGCVIPETAAGPPPATKERVSWSEMQRRAKERRDQRG